MISTRQTIRMGVSLKMITWLDLIARPFYSTHKIDAHTWVFDSNSHVSVHFCSKISDTSRAWQRSRIGLPIYSYSLLKQNAMSEDPIPQNRGVNRRRESRFQADHKILLPTFTAPQLSLFFAIPSLYIQPTQESCVFLPVPSYSAYCQLLPTPYVVPIINNAVSSKR